MAATAADPLPNAANAGLRRGRSHSRQRHRAAAPLLPPTSPRCCACAAAMTHPVRRRRSGICRRGRKRARNTSYGGGGRRAGVDRESPLAATLVQCIPRGDRMDWIVQKATELGVARIVPVLSARSVVRLDASQAASKAAHWRAVAVSACEQCGRNRLPVIEAPRPLLHYLGDPRPLGPRLLLEPEPGAHGTLETRRRRRGNCDRTGGRLCGRRARGLSCDASFGRSDWDPGSCAPRRPRSRQSPGCKLVPATSGRMKALRSPAPGACPRASPKFPRRSFARAAASRESAGSR